MNLQPTASSSEADNLILKSARASGKRMLIKFMKSVSLFRADQESDTFTNHLRNRIGFNHLQTCGIHFQKRPVLSQQFHAFRNRLQNRAEMNSTFGYFGFELFDREIQLLCSIEHMKLKLIVCFPK